MSNLRPATDSNLLIKVRDTKTSSRRTRVDDGPDPVTGKFWFEIDITAVTKDIYLPFSIASGKKPTGFVYQIEGTAEGSIVTTDISYKGDGVTQITMGTLVYCKIPVGMTAAFKIRVEVRGQLGKAYRVVIRQINYKFDPGDARYQKDAQDIHTKMEKFS